MYIPDAPTDVQLAVRAGFWRGYLGRARPAEWWSRHGWYDGSRLRGVLTGYGAVRWIKEHS